MNAIALLMDDHAKVKKLLAEIETTTERGVKTRIELFSKIKGEMGKTARQVFDAAELDDLGQRMEARKRSAAAELGIPLTS